MQNQEKHGEFEDLKVQCVEWTAALESDAKRFESYVKGTPFIACLNFYFLITSLTYNVHSIDYFYLKYMI